MKREYTYDEVFRSVKKIFKYLSDGRHTKTSYVNINPQILLRDFLLIYSFLKSFDIDELCQLHLKDCAEIDKIDTELFNIKKNIYKNLYVKHGSMSIKLVPYKDAKNNTITKYSNYQHQHDSEFYFFSCTDEEINTLKNNLDNLVINTYEEFEMFIEDFISKNVNYKNGYEDVYVNNKIIKEYLDINKWTFEPGEFRQYYYKYNYICRYKIPNSHTQSALLKKIIKYCFENNELNSIFTSILDVKIYNDNLHLDPVDFDMLKLFTSYFDNKTGEWEKIPNRSINIFVNNFIKILSLDIDVIINIFNKIQNNNSDVPSDFTKHIIEPIVNYQYENNARSFFFSGVGANSMLINSMLTLQSNNNLYHEDIDFATDDKDNISLTNRLLIYQIKNQDKEILDVYNINIFQDKILDKYDVVFTIAPELLNNNESELLIDIDIDDCKLDTHNRWTYPLPKYNLSSYVYVQNSLYQTKNTAYVLVPLSFISLNSFQRNTAYNEISMFNDNLKELIDGQNIAKVIQFPKKYFYHIKTECVLLELKKKPVDEIYCCIIGLKDPLKAESLDKDIIKTISYKASDKVKQTNRIKINGANYSTVLDESLLNYRINPQYYFAGNFIREKDAQLLKDDFLVKKVQRYSFEVNHEYKKGRELSIITVSDFTEFGIISKSKINKKQYINIDFDEIKRNKFKEAYQLQQYDILIYVHDPLKIAFCYDKMKDVVASHNLLIVRAKVEPINKEKVAKNLYMYFKSKEFRIKLKWLLTKDKNNRDIIRIKDLEKLEVNTSEHDLSNSIELLETFKKQYESLDYIKSMLTKSLQQKDINNDFLLNIQCACKNEYERNKK